MYSNRGTYRRIMSSLKQLYPKQLTGRQMRHLTTLTAMMCGIVLSQQSQLEKIARKILEPSRVESRVKKLTRFNQNEFVTQETFYLPFIELLVAGLARTGIVILVIDGSQTGRGCMTLMISILYRKRAIPLLWQTVKGTKGHLPEATHVKLLERVQGLLPADCQVVFLGDGEFDGLQLLAAIMSNGWEFVCRTACNRILVDGEDEFALNDVGLTRGDCIDLTDLGFTRANFQNTTAIAWWHESYEEPLYLVTNMECVGEACHWYRRRFRIETFFSDQKSRGFNLQKSHLSDPERVARFLIASCLAYVWMIYLGVQAKQNRDVMRMIHRVDRCDLSLFQLGLCYLEHLFAQESPILFGLFLPQP